MATLKAVVRMARADGFYPVYIRVTHHRASSFIKTDKMVTRKELTKTNEIKDPYVLQYCTQKILAEQKGHRALDGKGDCGVPNEWQR